MLKSNF